MGGSKEKYDERWWQRTSGRPRSSILAPSTLAMACRARRKQNQYLRVKRTRDGETDSHSHLGGCADCRSGSSALAVDVLDGRPQSSRSASSPTVRAKNQILLLFYAQLRDRAHCPAPFPGCPPPANPSTPRSQTKSLPRRPARLLLESLPPTRTLVAVKGAKRRSLV